MMRLMSLVHYFLQYAKYLEEHILEERKKKAESNDIADKEVRL